jgi:hypothetical protein
MSAPIGLTSDSRTPAIGWSCPWKRMAFRFATLDRPLATASAGLQLQPALHLTCDHQRIDGHRQSRRMRQGSQFV